MSGLTKLLTKVAGSGGIGVAGATVGGVFDMIGNVGRMRTAHKQAKEGQRVASRRESGYNKTFGDLLSMAEGLPTYKADLSGFDRVVSEASKQKAEASNLPPDALFREDARQTTANTIQSARRGARSATDLMSIAGMAGANENSAMRGINAQSANAQFDATQRANLSMLNALGGYASAKERGNEVSFRSNLDKQQSIMDITGQKGFGMADLQYMNSQEKMARESAFQEIKSSMWSGAGDIFRSIGMGMANQNMQGKQFDLFKSMYSTPKQFNFPEFNRDIPKLKPTGWGLSGKPE